MLPARNIGELVHKTLREVHQARDANSHGINVLEAGAQALNAARHLANKGAGLPDVGGANGLVES